MRVVRVVRVVRVAVNVAIAGFLLFAVVVIPAPPMIALHVGHPMVVPLAKGRVPRPAQEVVLHGLIDRGGLVRGVLVGGRVSAGSLRQPKGKTGVDEKGRHGADDAAKEIDPGAAPGVDGNVGAKGVGRQQRHQGPQRV